MFRRELIKGLSIAPLAFFLDKLPLQAKEIKEFPVYGNTKTLYRDFIILWTGWKFTWIDNVSGAGQWIAIHPEKHVRIYSSAPGLSGQYKLGDTFNISYRDWQRKIDRATPEEWKEEEKQKAYEILIMEIDAYYEPIKSFKKVTTLESGEGFRKPILTEVPETVQDRLSRMITEPQYDWETGKALF